jgi:hypothetical protein
MTHVRVRRYFQTSVCQKFEKKMEKNGNFFVFPLTVYPKRTPSLPLADPSFGKPWVGNPILPKTQVLTQDQGCRGNGNSHGNGMGMGINVKQ